MKRVACYVRVSTDEQKKHGLSVDNQISALEAFCKEKGYIVQGIYNDAGISARKSYRKRPALLQLLEDCKKGQIDLIIFTKLDRWFRSVGDYYEVQTQLEKYNVPWRAIWEDYETETSSGVFKVNIMLSVAQSEADRTSERIRSTFEYKRSKGDYLGTPPYGYKRVDGKLIKDEDTRELVEYAFKVFFDTHSTTSVLRALDDKGHSWSRHRVQRIIYGSAYAGDANGHECEPYISKEEHQLALQIKNSHVRTNKSTTAVYLFSRLCKCGTCGCVMRSLWHDCNGIKYYQYGCSGTDGIIKHSKGIYLSEIKIEKYLIQNLNDLIQEYNVAAVNSKPNNDNIHSQLRKKKKLEDQLYRVGIRFEVGDIDIEEYKSKRKALLKEMSSIDITAPAAPKEIVIPEDWHKTYQQLDKSHKKIFWYKILKSIIILSDKSISVDFL